MTTNILRSEVPENLFKLMMGIETYINNLGFDARTLELMRFRVSQINGCSYCLDMHYKEAIEAGEEPIRLYSLSAWSKTPFYSEKERCLLAWAEAITLIPENNISSELMDEMLQYFSKEEIANLTLAVAQINSWTRLAKTFGFEPGNYKAGAH